MAECHWCPHQARFIVAPAGPDEPEAWRRVCEECLALEFAAVTEPDKWAVTRIA